MLRKLALTALTAITLALPLSNSVKAETEFNCYSEIAQRAGNLEVPKHYVKFLQKECIPAPIIVLEEIALFTDFRYTIYRNAMASGFTLAKQGLYGEAKLMFIEAAKTLNSIPHVEGEVECQWINVGVEEAKRALKAANDAQYAQIQLDAENTIVGYTEWVLVSGIQN